MKSLSIKVLVLILAMTMIQVSCDDNFAEINTNPQVAIDIDPGFQFSWVLLRTSGGRYENWRAALIYSAMINQHLAALCGYWTGDKYTFNGDYSSSLFDRAYPEQVKDIQDLINTLEKGEVGDQTMLGMARIWRVVIFHRLTDLYGDIPYSEAGLGAISGVDFPTYDTQESIYADMLTELEQAVGQLGSGGFGAADFVYGGDVDKWRKFGNSLMLRLAMRLTERDGATARAWAAKAISGGIMQDNSDDAFIAHTNGPEGVNRNGIGEVLDKANGFGDDCPRLSATLVDKMVAKGDPRLDIFGVIPPGRTTHNGLPNGLDEMTILDNPTGTTIDDFDRINPLLVTVSTPMMFMTSAEAQLLAAEAIQRGYASGDAAAHYAKGIANGMGQWVHFNADFAIDQATVDAYVAANGYDASRAFELIGHEYWMATFLNEYEAWSNIRRLGEPRLVPTNYPGNITGGQLPRRLAYPASESGRAPFEEAKSRQGLGNDFPSFMSVPVWWDAN